MLFYSHFKIDPSVPDMWQKYVATRSSSDLLGNPLQWNLVWWCCSAKFCRWCIHTILNSPEDRIMTVSGLFSRLRCTLRQISCLLVFGWAGQWARSTLTTCAPLFNCFGATAVISRQGAMQTIHMFGLGAVTEKLPRMLFRTNLEGSGPVLRDCVVQQKWKGAELFTQSLTTPWPAGWPAGWPAEFIVSLDLTVIHTVARNSFSFTSEWEHVNGLFTGVCEVDSPSGIGSWSPLSDSGCCRIRAWVHSHDLSLFQSPIFGLLFPYRPLLGWNHRWSSLQAVTSMREMWCDDSLGLFFLGGIGALVV